MPQDWFAQNAPPTKQAAPQDWFAQNADASATPSPAQSDPSNPPYVPTASVSAQPTDARQHIADFISDLQNGGGHTALSRLLGKMQGRGDAGMSGLNSGVGAGAASVIGSPVLGAAHIVQGAQQLPSHPLNGAGTMIQGALEAGTIPGMVMGGPSTAAAINAVPSAAHAGQALGDVVQAVGHVPVALTKSLPMLERIQQLSARGGPAVKVADQIYQRANTVNPITFQEMRDFYSNLANPSVASKLEMNGPMSSAVSQFKSALHGDMTATAETLGKGEQYAQAMKEYARASSLGRTGDRLAQALKRYAVPALVGAEAARYGKDVLGGK